MSIRDLQAAFLISCLSFSVAWGFGDDNTKDTPTDSAATSDAKSEAKSEATPGRASAVFAGGCFWCVESDFEKAPGVIDIVAGYSGGRSKNPTYKNYASSGHREAIFVVYDPTQVTYAGLVEYLLKHVDPSDRTGSFIDKGPQYTAAIYYASPEEKAEAQRVVKAIEEMKVLRGRVTVPILPRQAFWPAEEYHQDYHTNNAAKYANYRATCGRDKFIQKLWGPAANQLTIPGAFPSDSQIAKVKQEITNAAISTSLASNHNDTKGSGKDSEKELAAWMTFKKPSDRELRKKLTPIQFDVTQKNGTEIAFRNPFWNNHDEGLYVDVVSGEPLFASVDKFDSGTGWPSFVRPVDPRLIVSKEDRSEMPVRTEVRSRIADSHLGHVFNDGPVERGGLRYCINSASLRFIPKPKLQAEGYAEFLPLFEGK
ncbi:MAG: peptide-methionine (R)-S-oxide reductase MsrB [Pirellulaceae bacterium]|nr:peptide-methionine (R)-S-oxide reductase MsrB [Pirellulaceae bacterium]